jgi:hypothetical protein
VHGDHVLRRHLSGTNTGVEAFGDDVGQAVVDHDLQLDVRVVRQKLVERWPQDGPYRVIAGGDADGARGLVAQLAQRGHLRLDLVKARPRGMRQAVLRLGRRDAAGGTGQQPRAQPRFQPPRTVRLSADCDTPSCAAPETITDPDVVARVRGFHAAAAIPVPADSFALTVAFDIGQPEDVGIDEILFRPSRQEM